jgi:hypothetical protein
VGARCPSFHVPCGWGTVRPFIGQGGSSLHACRTIFPTCGGVASSATELTAVLANPAPVGASWHAQCSYRSGFEGGGVVVGHPAVVRGPIQRCRQRGACTRHSGGRGASCPRALQHHRGCRHSARVALQWRGWPHRVDSDGKDRSRRPDVTAWPCVVTEKVFESTAGPLRGLGALAVRG